MHGLGNDFVVIDSRDKPFVLPQKTIQALAHRHTGIGFDQLLVLESARTTEHDFFMRIFNTDGSEVGQCGNGARAIVKFIERQALSKARQFKLGTLTSSMHASLLDDGHVKIDMGKPVFDPTALPTTLDTLSISQTLVIAGQAYPVVSVSMGNPHCVLQVDDCTSAAVLELSPLIQTSAYFPASVNVGFMQILDAKTINLRVYERGVGETLACGSGACAAVVAGRRLGLLSSNVTVQLQYGCLNIEWLGDNHSVYMSGPASHIFSGSLNC